MRQLGRNKVCLWYALHRESEIIYKKDSQGNKIVSYIDTSVTPPITYYEEEGQTKEGYSKPVKFFGNIAYAQSGESQTTEFGISTSEYESMLVVNKGEVPIIEQSLIFMHKPLVDDDGYAVEGDADFRVVKVHPSLNEDKFLLGKIQK